MSQIQLSFPTEPKAHAGRYRLMELPKELVTLMDSDAEALHRFTIRGKGDDDAVLCTSNRTYAIKNVDLSNAYCVMTPPQDSESGDAVLRDTVHHIIELTPTIPRLHRLRALLRDQVYDQDSDLQFDEASGKTRIKYAQVRSEVQASDYELDEALKEKRILNLNGFLRPISLSHLNGVLELLLNTLVSMSLSPNAAPVMDLAETLHSEHEIPQDVLLQVLVWFGEMDNNQNPTHSTWKMNAKAVVKQLGVGILSEYRSDPIKEADLLDKWRQAVGDAFEDLVNLNLLKGNYIISQTSSATPLIKYFPAVDLPATAPERFADLFLTKIRWDASEIEPFLDDIAVDSKDRDKLLLKYARNTVERDGQVWYSAK